jgi:HD-GYP domain-containing protein (c-di-GMP phosphodiesterase class II)
VEQCIEKALAASAFEPISHTKRLLVMAEKMAATLTLSPDESQRLYQLVRFHDMGKLVLPEMILFKQNRNPEEELILRSHVEKGYNIARGSFHLTCVAQSILAHHENFNGRGYPLGLAGEDIPFLARVLRVMHAYDSLTAPIGLHKKSMKHAAALAAIRRGAGKIFDPQIAQVFYDVFEKGNDVDKNG